jgi:hypothetical protein
VIEDFHARDHWDSVPFGPSTDADFLLDLFSLSVADYHGVESVVEGLAEETGDVLRLGLAGEKTPPAAPEREETAGVCGDLTPADTRLTFRRAAAPGGEQPAEVRVALSVLRKKDDRGAVVQRDLGPQDEGDAQLLGRDVGADDAGDSVTVREGDGTDAILLAGLHQFFRVRCPLEKGEVALAPEGDIGTGC